MRNAVLGSLLVHAVLGIAGRLSTQDDRHGNGSTSLVDVELAPAPPKAQPLPDEIAAANVPTAPPGEHDTPEPPPPPEEETGGDRPDAAPVDARSRRRKDAAELLAAVDAAPADDATDIAVATGDAATIAAANVPVLAGDAAPAGTGSGSGAGTGTGGAIVAGVPAIAGEPGPGGTVSAGTASNLLAYFPAGHVVTALVRLDRVRGTIWQEPIVKLFKPMPDHKVLIGDRPLDMAELFDTLVISSPEPRDATATTLVARTRLPRPRLRDVLDEPDTPVTWSAARGGMLGTRRPGARVPKGDRRQFLSPYLGWIVLAQPGDLGGLTAPAPTAGKADLDKVVASTALPAWLAKVKTIEAETGHPDGPTAIVTVAGVGTRYELPDVGVGVTSVPAPERMTVALQIVKHGFIVQGNLKFAREADAIEMVEAVTKARQRALDSTLHQGVLRRGRVLNAVKGLTLDRRGTRVSYATSLSIKDAQGLLEVAARTLARYFEAQARNAP